MHQKKINALMKWLENTVKMCLLLIILRPESFVETGVRDLENELHYLIIFQCIYYYYAESKVENVFAIYFKTNIQNCFVLVYFVCHTKLDRSKFQFYCFLGLLFIVVMEISIFTKCKPR